MTRRGWIGVAAASPLLQAQDPAPKIGIIGLGSRSRAHVNAFRNMPEAKVVALSDIDSARMTAASQQLGGSPATYTDYRELLADRNVQVVAIVTPNYLHHEMAIAALRAGKDVVLEKPLGINYKQAAEVLREARRSGRTVAVCMQRRYTKQDREVQHAVESGLIGNVKLIQVSEMRGDWNPQGWRFNDKGKLINWRFSTKAAGNTELEFSIHALSHVYTLVKSPLATVSASGGVVFYKDRDTRDLSSILVEFQNGARLNYSFSCFAPRGGNTFSVLGDKGVLRREGGKLMLHPHTGQPQAAPAVDGPDLAPEVQLYREFFQNIREKSQSPLAPDFAIEPMKIAFAADLSIAENRVVTARDFA